MDLDFFEKGNLDFFKQMKRINYLGHFYVGNIVYLSGIKVFYSNLEKKRIGGNNMWITLVEGVKITLLIMNAFGLKFDAALAYEL